MTSYKSNLVNFWQLFAQSENHFLKHKLHIKPLLSASGIMIRYSKFLSSNRLKMKLGDNISHDNIKQDINV